MSFESTYSWILIFAFSAMLLNSIGIWVIYTSKEWAERFLEHFMCFAAGTLIASALIIAFPQAVAQTSHAGTAALAGFLFMFFSSQIIKKRSQKPQLALGLTALEGIAIHSFVDGVIYTVTFSVSTLIGFVAGTGLVVHEFAEGVITYSVLLKGGIPKRKAVLYAFFAAALTTPVGAVIAYPVVKLLSPPVLGMALGFVVGVLIFTSAAHLLPEVQEHQKKHSYLAFLAGVALAILDQSLGPLMASRFCYTMCRFPLKELFGARAYRFGKSYY